MMQTQECLWFQLQPKLCPGSIFTPIYNVLHSGPVVLPCLNATRMVPTRQSLGEHKPSVTTWQPNQPCGCSSSTTYRVLILQEFPAIPILVQKERQVFCLLCCKGIITKLILMHCKRGQDVLPGISPRIQVRVQLVRTQNPEGHFQGCCSYLRWAHSREM